MTTLIFQNIRFGFVFLSFALLAVSCNAQHATEIYSPSGKAINGYDPVAFFSENRPVKGRDSFIYKWKEANWYFSSQQHLNAFKASPEKYSPQYGGYCAYGTAQGYKAPTQPETFTIDNGKLYLNYNNTVKKEWDKDRHKLIVKADAAWPAVKMKKE